MSKEKLTNQLKKAYKSLEEESKNKGRPNTIKDNNVDYNNNNIYAMRQKISELEAKLTLHEQSNKVLNDQLNQATEHIGELEDYYTGYTEALVTENLELKQQLAESEKKNFELIAKLNLKEHKPAFCTLADRECEALGKVEELKQRIAEKDEEINDWKDGTIICKWTDAENKVKDLEHQLAEKEELIMFADRTIRGLVLAKEIDKISFCIEELVKAKETIECVLDNALKNCSLNQSYYDRLLGEIDNQIKQLKEGK